MNRIVLIGNVDYGERDPADIGKQWKCLPGTQSEIDRIKELSAASRPETGIDVLTGGAATEAALREKLANCSVLHIATHGLFTQREQAIPRPSFEGIQLAGDDRPRSVTVHRSGLVLADANRSDLITNARDAVPDDGLFMADELLGIPLGHVDLVTLSACDTAQGEQRRGEGLLSIQRAFQVAGAKNTIATHWKIDDSATSVIMERFYSNLWSAVNGKPRTKLDALRDAQLWALRNPDEFRHAMAKATSHDAPLPCSQNRGADAPEPPEIGDRLPPYYWAAFTLSGDGR